MFTISLLCLIVLVPGGALPSDPFQKPETSLSKEYPGPHPHSRPSLPAELRFGITPFLPEEVLRREFQPLMEYLSHAIHIPVRLIIAPDYEGLVTLLETSEIDIASFSPLAYVLGKRRNASIRLLLGQIVGGATSYTTYIIVHSASKIQQLDQLKGKVFAFVDRHSASGYLFPYAFFLNQGIDPENYFKEVVFAGNHRKAIQYVLEGKVDAAATYSEGLMAARESGLRVRSLRIIKKTGRIPFDAVCARGDLDLNLVQQVKSLLLHLDTNDEQGRTILGEILRINGWIEVDDEQYAAIRQVLDLIEGHAKPTTSTGGQ